jgi:hypothetical protein
MDDEPKYLVPKKNAGRLPGDFFHSFSAGAEKL